ncbi:fibronectin type III domain-containing protein [Phocaeicola sp.]|uniref:fibronectin type III domain-containing protein n=1 Tax=Phocaeicola sp. TaxID=2773926 RepID=UPI003A8CD094
MKVTKNIYGLGLSVALSGMLLASCTDANDWEVDASFDRLFGTKQSSFTVTEGAVTAEVKWDATVNTEYYIIEVSTDSLYNDIPMGAENSIVYGEDGSITQSPYTLTGLLGETTYYLRIKSMSKDKQSNWVYLPDYKFTTDKEQILNEPSETEITDESVSLTWEAGLEVTHITYTQDGALVTYELTDEEKAAGKVTLMGLNPNTEYTVTIYNGEIVRGEIEVTTGMSVEVESEVSEITQHSAVFTWTEGVGRLTGYVLLKGDVYPSDETQNVLSVEEETACRLELNNLEPSTMYTVAIMRDKVVRARKVFQTAVGIPSDYTQVTLTSRDDWAGALNDNSGKLAIIIPQGTTIDLTANTSFQTEIPAAVTSLILWGEEGEDNTQKPTFKTRGLSLSGDKSEVRFYNLNVESNGTSNYIFRQKGTGTIESLSFESCNIANAAGVFCERDKGSGTLKNLLFSDCVLTNIGNYSVVYTTTNYIVNKVTMTNSTVNGCTGNMFRVAQTEPYSLEITASTLYNASQALVRSDGYNSANIFTISNTLIGTVNTTTPNNNNSVTGTNVYTTSDCYSVNWAIKTELEATDLFEDPANGIFVVKAADYKAYGDPRWNK